ncbi:MAG TPA: tRNA (adenosine(37)-N6)-threonylcarbamoyltransferase complex transferase subunit TsaD [Candidatus Paceibacterota bacterium]|nr:tRNA (adenosine(37)-N6)-threonylcarbamoyltransferase complex transferase subunit TsaD [Candidatus Paceibacterota bacterium]
MKLLAIETSCDETAIAILECDGDETSARFRVIGNALLSQIDIHKEYGGVFPAVAKREHAKNLVPILYEALAEAEMIEEDAQVFPPERYSQWGDLLQREPGLTEAFIRFVEVHTPPKIDAIAVTAGPGLEPALWVGVNFAQALSAAWNIPVVPVNHMEGHLLSGLSVHAGSDERKESLKNTEVLELKDVAFPVLALLISGGHTELVLMKDWLSYELLGATRDDAVGEAFDKVARMLHLPYPGGPEVSKLAERDREDERTNPFSLPRPMVDSPDLDFSFSGLKTAVLYEVKDRELGELEKEQLARAFEDAAADVLWKKSAKALEETGAQTLVLGGGVSANKHIQRVFTRNIAEHPGVSLRIPTADLTTDNAVMIGIAGYLRALRKEYASDIKANGNLRLA